MKKYRWLSMPVAALAILATAYTVGNAQNSERVLVVAIPEIGPLELSIPKSRSDGEKMLSHLGDFLVQENKASGGIEGSLAEEYSLSPDGKTWTFKLRQGIKFHPGPNGEDYGELTADDVKFSWEQWISEESTHGQRSVYRDAVGGDIANFVIKNDYEFSITADQRFTSFLNSLCSCEPGMTVFPRKYYESTPPEVHNNHPLGTGPWIYANSAVGEYIEFVANKNYWGGEVTADRLIIREVPDDAARMAQVLAGEVDIALLGSSLMGEAAATDVQLLALDNILNVSIFFGGAWWGEKDIEHLDRDAPWIQADNPERGLAIRQAMSLAINRQLILEKLLFGKGELTYAPVIGDVTNSNLVEESWEFPKYDLELARQKLAEGGYPDGFDVGMPMIQFGDVDTVVLAETVAGFWEELGLNVTRMPMEDDPHAEALDAYESDGWAWVHPQTITPEPAKIVATFQSGVSPRKFSHPAIDEGYRKMQEGLTYDDRAAAAREMLTALRDDMAAITLFNADMVFIANNTIAKWKPEKANFETDLWEIEYAN